MTWIEATCPTCGTVDCAPEAFELTVCSNSPISYYVFTCPICDERIQKAANQRAIELLISEGVQPITWSIPDEALEEHTGPTFTADDVLDFHLLLEGPDWFQGLEKADH